MVQEYIGSWNIHKFSCTYFTQTFTGYALKSEICTKFFISFTPTSLQFTASNFHKGLHKFLHKIYNMNSPQILLLHKVWIIISLQVFSAKIRTLVVPLSYSRLELRVFHQDRPFILKRIKKKFAAEKSELYWPLFYCWKYPRISL